MTDQEHKTVEYLAGYISEHKQTLIDRVILNRTRHITLVLEDVYQPQNASAVIRTADCFGIQEVHIIENKHKFKLNPRVTHGSSKWVDVKQYNEELSNGDACIDQLKADGYRIVATVPDQTANSIHDIDIEQKTAIVFGTEKTGISNKIEEKADEFVTVPMYGFTESFNISVSVALVLNTVIEKLASSNLEWKLNKEEQDLLRLEWYRNMVHRSDLLEKGFLKTL